MTATNFQSLSIARQLNNRPILFGVALSKEQVIDSNVKKYARYIFDSITCFDDMKPDSIRTITNIGDYSNGSSYNFTNLNDIMNYAKNNLMKVSGASLWDDPEHNPSPLNSLTDKTTMSNILNQHVTQTINHFKNTYKNLVYNWQVLDETDDTTSQAKRVLGTSYFSDLYNYAENAVVNTQVKLFYNDDYDKIDKHEDTLLSLKKYEKIDGIGVKCHVSSTDISVTRTLPKILSEIEDITKKYRSYGFEVHFTEIDFNTATVNHSLIDDYYVGLLDIALKYGVTSYTVWGLKDDLSPLSLSAPAPAPRSAPAIQKYPLLLDSSFKPKACYTAILDKLKTYHQESTNYDIFIILGQSNSIGWGRTIDPNIEKFGSTMEDDYNNKEDPLIEQWTNYAKDSSGNKPKDEIIVAKERLYHLDPGTNGDYGLAISFARQYIREGKLSNGRKILLIGSGWNGTGFLTTTNSDPDRRARSGHWRVMTGTKGYTELPRLYDMSLDRIRSAISPGNVGPNSLVKGIFWVQGEADAVASTKSSTTIPAPRLPPSCPPSPATVNANKPEAERNSLLNEYEGHLTLMLNQLRINVTKYINNVRTFNVPKQLVNAIPILIGSIPNLRTPCNYRDDYLYMIERLKNIPSKCIIPNSKFVPSDDSIDNPVFDHYLTTGGPEFNYHYNKSSQIEFGKRFFYFYNNLSINTDTDYDIFIVMGQSNSVGRGVLEDSDIPKIGTTMMNDDYDNVENPYIKMYDGSNNIIPAKERMFHLSNQHTPTVPPTTYYGFGVSFARQYVKENKLSRYRKVLLIGCGYDGAGVLKTQFIDSSGNARNIHNWNSNIRDSLYDKAITRVRNAIDLPSVGRGSEIKGILWHQGETDATYIKSNQDRNATYNNYKTELKKTLDGLRTEFTNIINIKRTSIPPIPSRMPAAPPCPTKPAPAPALAGGAAPRPAPRPAPAPLPAAVAALQQVATNIPILLGSILKINAATIKDYGYGYEEMIPIIKDVAEDTANKKYSFVPVTDISGTVFTKTLTGNGMTDRDTVHLNKSSQIELGKRYFYIYNGNRINIT